MQMRIWNKYCLRFRIICQLIANVWRMQSQMFFLLVIIISQSLAGRHDYRLVGLLEEDNYPVSEIWNLERANSNNLILQKHQKPKGKPLKVEGELNLRNIQKVKHNIDIKINFKQVDDQNLCISLEITLRWEFPAVQAKPHET